MTSSDAGEVAIARADLVSLFNKKDQALVVSTWLRQISIKATKIATECRAKGLWNTTVRHIANVISLDTNKGMCEEFRDYFQKLFTMEHG